ncbi:MAG TPA: hypothetical protein ENH19_01845 [Actinobacteria bacterium]|nr:hypothetical protein [Actinomycetes bacterium]HEX21378.1 hypothetical protein [Actinomycetota bacterium]
MPITESFIILVAAIGAVLFLFANDYYYRYLDRKSLKVPLVKVDNSQDIESRIVQDQPTNDKNMAA